MMNNILLVDSDRKMLRSLTILLQSQGGFLHILPAENSQHAVDILRRTPVKIAIVAIKPPEAPGLELVTRLAEEYPAMPVIVLAAENLPLLRACIKRFPTAIYLEQAHDLDMLSKRVYSELEIDYGGQIRGVSLSAFLQMMALETCTCTLKVAGNNQYGTLWLEDGEIVAARLPAASGDDAVLQMLLWPSATIDIDYRRHPVSHTVSMPLMKLLMEGSRRDDEQQRRDDHNLRRHQRHDLLVAIDYDVGNTTRHCLLKNISQGGAYIETSHDLAIGETITLSLNSPVLNSSCTIEAKVVRRDLGGIGIKFQPTSPYQSQLIRVMIDSGAKLPPFSERPDEHLPRELELP
ncbi:MAG: DUF4388 domain-containing protein [Desulfopila sp.]